MRLVEIVTDVWQRLTRHVEQVGVVEIPRREDQPPAVDPLGAESRLHGAVQAAAVAVDSRQSRVGADPKRLGARHAAIVLEGFFARGFGAGADQRVAPDLEPLGRREEHHPDGITNDGVRHRSGVDHQWVEAAAFRRDRAGQSDRACTDDEN